MIQNFRKGPSFLCQKQPTSYSIVKTLASKVLLTNLFLRLFKYSSNSWYFRSRYPRLKAIYLPNGCNPNPPLALHGRTSKNTYFHSLIPSCEYYLHVVEVFPTALKSGGKEPKVCQLPFSTMGNNKRILSVCLFLRLSTSHLMILPTLPS